MKYILFLYIFAFGVMSAYSQISNVTEVFPLPESLSESSGVIYFNNKLITHNDSGGLNQLYEVDVNTGLVTRTVTILNATHVDWEDITQDNTSIYIADIGNNNGTRTDLKIYKINKTDYTNTDTVTAEIININYAEQNDFTYSPNNTEWDAEALVSFNDENLMLFSKNWIDGITKAYLVPKTPEMHALLPLSSTLTSEGLITGGTFNTATQKLYLVGYNNFLQPFVWESENFSDNNIFSGNNVKTELSSLGFEQVEAVTFKGDNSYFVTSESFDNVVSDYAKLISFTTNDDVLSLYQNHEAEQIVSFYPNPVKNRLNINSEQIRFVEIFDMTSTKLYSGDQKSIDMSNFATGIYIIRLHSNQNRSTIAKLVKQ